MVRSSVYTRRTSFMLLLLLATVGFTYLAPIAIVDSSAQISTDSNNSDQREVKIDSLYGARSVHVGTEQNYRVRISPGAEWPIRYNWVLDGAIDMIGNNVVYIFDTPGIHTLGVEVSNRVSKDFASIQIIVTDPAEIKRQENLLSRLAEPEPVAPVAEEDSTIQRPEEKKLPDGSYYSWVVESDFNRPSAQITMNEVKKLGFKNVRIYRDSGGSGSVIFRVLVGKYSSSQSAMNAKNKITTMTGRAPNLTLIKG